MFVTFAVICVDSFTAGSDTYYGHVATL